MWGYRRVVDEVGVVGEIEYAGVEARVVVSVGVGVSAIRATTSRR